MLIYDFLNLCSPFIVSNKDHCFIIYVLLKRNKICTFSSRCKIHEKKTFFKNSYSINSSRFNVSHSTKKIETAFKENHCIFNFPDWTVPFSRQRVSKLISLKCFNFMVHFIRTMTSQGGNS